MKPGSVAFLVTLAVIGSGCGSGADPAGPARTGPASGGGATGTTRQPLPAYDPPRQFSPDPVYVGNGRVAVADGVAYSYSDTSLVAIELATGSKRWSAPLPGASNVVNGPVSSGNAPGIVTDGNGQQLVVAAYYNRAEGTGTQQDSDHTQVVAVDTAGTIRWQATVRHSSLGARVVGELRDDQGSAVVIDAFDTVVLDASTGNVRWTGQRVKPVGVDGDRVIGVRAAESESDPWTTVALRGSDGGQLWVGPALTSGTGVRGRPPALTLAGPGRATVSGLSEDFEGMTVLIDTATGRPVASIPKILGCLFDDRDTVVCAQYARAGEVSELVVGVDVGSGKQLWRLPDEAGRRTGLNVTAAFHGAVYGSGTRTSVILDARTGGDLVGDARISPTRVLPGYGFVTSPGDTMVTEAYRATG